MLTKQDEDKLGKFFANAFHEVVVPFVQDITENLASKDDIDRLETKVNKINNSLDRHDTKLDNHEKRIGKLETKFPLVS